MSKTRLAIFGTFAAICVLLIPYVALSKEGEEDAAIVATEPQDAEGKRLFATNCAACHTLTAAGADGVVGPNLDEILAPPSYEGNYSRVLQAVVCGLGGRMPKGILVEQEAKDVAAFVAAYAGQLGEGQGPLVDTSTAPAPGPSDCQPASS